MIKTEKGSTHLSGDKAELCTDLTIIIEAMKEAGFSNEELATPIELSLIDSELQEEYMQQKLKMEQDEIDEKLKKLLKELEGE